MPLARMTCAMGDAAPVAMLAAGVVPLSPPDGSVDTNTIVITGSGNISSFGASSDIVTKKVTFQPAGVIGLIHSATLVLLGSTSRSMTAPCHGEYRCDGNNKWTELFFTSDATTPGAIEERVTAVEGRATALEGRATALEGRAAALEGRATALENRATALESRMATAEASLSALDGRVSALESA